MGQTQRADALDAMRGLAILLMILSGNIHHPPLPAWMYHAQVPPPQYTFDPNLPGITWVDLVFPMFLFAMGAAFPLALRKKIESGVPQWKIVLHVLQRGLLLAAFAIFVQHVKPYALHSDPTTGDWLVGLAGFLLLFPILLRLPPSVSPRMRYAVKAGGIAAAAALLCFLRYPDGTGFSVSRSDIIILVLANVALFGSLVWLWTRDNIVLRLGLLGFLLALRLTHGIEGSWNQWLWNATPFPWLYTLYFLQYLFIVIPGTVAGDLIYRWMHEAPPAEGEPSKASGARMGGALMLMASLLLVNLTGLYARQLLPTLAADILCCLLGFVLFAKPRSSLERLLSSLFAWGAYWLLLGIFFEAYEGGIKKDHATLSYYFVTDGLAIFTTIGFAVVIDFFRKRRAVSLLIDCGKNPMIAYIGASNAVHPLLGLTTLSSVLSALATTPWLGFAKGVIVTLLVALITSFFTRRSLFWRT